MSKWLDPKEQPFQHELLLDRSYLYEVAFRNPYDETITHVGIGEAISGQWLVTTRHNTQIILAEADVVAYRQYTPPEWPE